MVKGWDYPALVEAYQKAAQVARTEHMPSIVHVSELTQPQGHSTSGSHERYKSKERLAWEAEWDCVKKFRQWLIAQGIATAEMLDQLEAQDRRLVEEIRKQAWEAYQAPIRQDRQEAAGLIEAVARSSAQREALSTGGEKLLAVPAPLRRDVSAAVHQALVLTRREASAGRDSLVAWSERWRRPARSAMPRTCTSRAPARPSTCQRSSRSIPKTRRWCTVSSC